MPVSWLSKNQEEVCVLAIISQYLCHPRFVFSDFLIYYFGNNAIYSRYLLFMNQENILH
jgi:hypothetical protein